MYHEALLQGWRARRVGVLLDRASGLEDDDLHVVLGELTDFVCVLVFLARSAGVRNMSLPASLSHLRGQARRELRLTAEPALPPTGGISANDGDNLILVEREQALVSRQVIHKSPSHPAGSNSQMKL